MKNKPIPASVQLLMEFIRVFPRGLTPREMKKIDRHYRGNLHWYKKHHGIKTRATREGFVRYMDFIAARAAIRFLRSHGYVEESRRGEALIEFQYKQTPKKTGLFQKIRNFFTKTR